MIWIATLNNCIKALLVMDQTHYAIKLTDPDNLMENASSLKIPQGSLLSLFKLAPLKGKGQHILYCKRTTYTLDHMNISYMLHCLYHVSGSKATPIKKCIFMNIFVWQRLMPPLFHLWNQSKDWLSCGLCSKYIIAKHTTTSTCCQYIIRSNNCFD